MKLSEYLIDKIGDILIFILGHFTIIMLLIAFKSEPSLIFSIIFINCIIFLSIILIDYFRKKKFYSNLLNNVENLDKKYLILEMIEKPGFYEGKIFYELLYEINKSMIENVKEYSLSINEFKEYVEMWIHEVKIPISSLVLLNHNHKNELSKKYEEQIRRLDNYIDQILYYVRSENVEKDYIIKGTSISSVIKSVALKNKDDLIENDIELDVKVNDENVLTDSKWLEFMLNQIINNSIKYRNQDKKACIKITTEKIDNKVTLSIYDNGIGIKKSDLPQIFNKSYTGDNGRKVAKSTGMGLYIVKNLCEKLGHKLDVESEYGKFTKVQITFYENDFYKF